MQKGSATGRLLVSSCHARAPDYGETTLGTICTDALRQHEKESLTNFPARGRSISRFTQIREGTAGRCIARNETTDEAMIAIIVNLAIYRICQHSKPRPGKKERQSWEGREASGTVRTLLSSVAAAAVEICGGRRSPMHIHTGNAVIWPK